MNLLYLNIIWIVVTVVVVLIGIPAYLKHKEASKNGTLRIKQKAEYAKRYAIYTTNVFTRKRFRRITRSFSSMMCFDNDSLKAVSVKTFERAVIIAALVPIIGTLLFKDVLLTIMLVLVGYVIYNISVDNKIDKQEIEIRKALSFTLQSIRDTYAITDNIPRAIIGCERESCLERPIAKIYEILTDENGDELLKRFKRTNPVRILGSLAETCYLTNNNGDLKAGNGQSSFKDELMILRKEADTGVRKLTKMQLAFKSYHFLALVGLFICPIADWFLLTFMPGTTVYVNGTYGSIVKALTICLTLLTYYIISVMNRPSVVNQVDKIEYIDKLSKETRFMKILDKLEPKKFKTRYKLNKRVQGALSSKNTRYIYMCKLVMSTVLMAFTFVCLVVFVISAKTVLWNTYGSLELTGSQVELTDEMLEEMKKIDALYLNTDPKMPDEDASALISDAIPGMKSLEVEEQVDRLSTKYDYYHAIGFKWYFVLIAYGVGVIGWFSPEISLIFRKRLVKFETTEDVMQLQTMMITLSNTKMDVYKALKWLMTESTIHKAILRQAWINYPSDPEKAISQLKSSCENRDMKRLVSKLGKAIYSLSLHDAFNDMILDKEQSLIINEMYQDEQIKSKVQYAKLLVAMSAGFSLFANFLGPIGLLGVKQLLSTFALLQNG